MSQQGGGYTYTSNPRPLYRKGEGNSSVYRDPSLAETRPANIMFDARVVRGIAHGKPVISSASKKTAALDAAQSAANAKKAILTEQRRREAEKTQMINDGLIRPTLKSVHEMHRSIVIPKKRTELKLSLYLGKFRVDPLYDTRLSHSSLNVLFYVFTNVANAWVYP